MKNINGMDDLLKESFLELDFDQPENEQLIQALSDSVMCSNSFQGVQSKYSIKNLVSKISLQSILWVVASIAICALAIYLFTNQQPKKSAETVAEKEAKSESKVTAVLPEKVQKAFDENINRSADQMQQNNVAIIETRDGPITKVFQSIETSSEKRILKETVDTQQIVAPSKKVEQPYVFPILTEKEIKATEKQKKKMSDQLVKLNKSIYPFIPKGSMMYKDATITSGGFYMQNHEVTNLEYRTFLFDLLIQNRKQEFLIAKPDQSQWINSNNTAVFDHLKDLYFSDKLYDEYPIVNISVEGAKMYCNWLNELLRSRPDRQQEYAIQLPTEVGWVYAAKGGLNKGSYPWGTDSIQNRNNAFLANFNVQLLKEQFNQPIKYTKMFGNTLKLSYTACTSAGLVMNKDTVATVGVENYNPNWYGLYCMSGNAAEWALSTDGKSAKALGGSWGSDFEHLKITGENEFPGKKSSPFIGFRFIIIPLQE
ncbi:MAG TPA: SUMF1/EgtB/PvdO family nonheme iron enzyme [Bacteroidia bacterium]|nr:SUMF1/EgtB/PvdO family nonheme iron enzyme [Bacteroidia bacterium]